jgi:antitoxin ParD1/3/4
LLAIFANKVFIRYILFMATTTMNISLPDTMRSFVEERLETDGFGSASEYVRDLIRADQKRQEELKLEKLLLKRLSSKGKTLDLDDVRNELAKRRGSK